MLLGVSADAVYWTSGARVSGASLDTLPAPPLELVASATLAVHADDHVLAVAGQNVLSASVATPARRVATTAVEALAESDGPTPRLVWSVGDTLSWGPSGDVDGSATLNRTTHVDHIRAAPNRFWVASDGTADRRLLFVDRETTASGVAASSARYADSFPGGGADGATYRGRIVDATDDAALWLVEELPSTRAVLVEVPAHGTPSVLLEHVMGAAGFFATDDALYWQEGDALLTAPRSGGAASIAVHLPGTAGALADGFVYYVEGGAIMRLAL